MKQEYDFSKASKGRFFHPNARFNLPDTQRTDGWLDHGGGIHKFIADETEKTLQAYRAQPNLVEEHAKQERDTAHGGYAHRQLFELVQNSADALAALTRTKQGLNRGSILVRLRGNYLYCADDGDPISTRGVRALMFSHMSPKRNTTEIGRFGLGFKSVLSVTSRPEFFGRSGSFRFDGKLAAERIAEIARSTEYPVLRLPACISAKDEADRDDELAELMTWASNIVRLPLDAGAHDDLAKQIEDFPAEFLLFVDHVRHLTFETGDVERDLYAEPDGDGISLDTGLGRSLWKCFRSVHTLSDDALADRRSLDDDGEVPIWWAAPLDRLNEPGHYWHFFPTQTTCLLAGILNAPWKTNEDRQNLLPGPYNDDLIEAAARLAAKHLPDLASTLDPASHLDALPRRREAGDTEQSNRLRDAVDGLLQGCPITPDQRGHLRKTRELRVAPRSADMEALRLWESVEKRPENWVHHRALVRDRMAKVDRVYSHDGWPKQVPRASISEWLEALVAGSAPKRAIEASKAALRVAAAISVSSEAAGTLGKVVWTESGEWAEPDPDSVFLPSADHDAPIDGANLVNRELASDADALVNLGKLGIGPLAPEVYFRIIANEALGGDAATEVQWRRFWSSSRQIETNQAASIVGNRSHRVHVLTQSGCWKALYAILLPGAVVSEEAGEDAGVAADVHHHARDLELLHSLGAVSEPQERYDFATEPGFNDYRTQCRVRFTARDLPRNPHWDRLCFKSTHTSGPLHPLELLSDRGKARYSSLLLSMEAAFAKWVMRHETQDVYPPLECENPALLALRRHGRVWCAGTHAPLADALGHRPANPTTLNALLSLPMATRIKEAFDLSEPIIEPTGEEEPVPLTDAWPGLAPYLHRDASECNLIRCLRIAEGALSLNCLRKGTEIYLVATGDDTEDLRSVCQELGLPLDVHEVSQVLSYVAPANTEAARARIRACETDAARLTLAVGEDALRRGLPESLVAVFEKSGPKASSNQMAEAAIATYHTSALRQYRHALNAELSPPRQWAGSASAVTFVKALGFSAQWAGQRNERRAPYVEVEGPLSLPPLHQYQETIVQNVCAMLLGRGRGEHRRGMISLPTGSGKTRVAVEAVVRAINRGFSGGVLWVADRDELCEQAVEAWRQVWSSAGTAGARLRISRMWAGQPRPMPENDRHVVVASIQTLYARLNREPVAYSFLRSFALVVFDEAHRTLAPSFTTVMEDIGFTRRRTNTEPFLIGLTATPYRGHDESETARLVRRYGTNRLDLGAFNSDDPVAAVKELQGMRVIAGADHEVIDGGGFRLNDEEREQINAMPHPAWLPRSMESRIARDANRTERIVAAYERLIGNRGWPTLVFATSVEHAQTVAALLNTKGIPSRAVSGGTESIVRRNIVEDFRAGKIAALVNYGVFREGFDAPKTRAIIVARPVYSPNLYFQMIGRGLRGPMNGGNDRCLIINVRDNIENFERQLAFAELDWLWRQR